MKTDYGDILERLGLPLWWDEHGAPRYEPFDPFLCNTYAWVVALMEIECQWCGKKFNVAVSMSELDLWNWQKHHPDEDYHPTPRDANGFYYGDPPRHGSFEECPAGDTMSSIPVRVLEFWEWNRETFEWERKREYEVTFIQEEPVDDWRDIR